MTQDKQQVVEGMVIVFTGDGKGKTSAALGLMVRALGAGKRVAFVQFIKNWQVSEHKFIKDILKLYPKQLFFYKGGAGFFEARELSSKASREEHLALAKETYQLASQLVGSGEYDVVICDEINNAVHDGLLPNDYLEKIIQARHLKTTLCLTGRNFPKKLIPKVSIASEMVKVKHHYDEGQLAVEGIDF